MGTKKTEDKALVPPRPNVEMTSMGLMPTNIDDGYRFAKMISRSQMVPEAYQNNPDNCLVAIDLSLRWGVSWLVVMQHVYMVHNRPALDAALCIALTNKSGIFVDPIEYEVQGDDARADNYRVRAFATRRSTGKVLKGPWIDWKLVKGEGWDKPKKGFPSKWMTMADQMFHYRAAVWFQRRFCPEVAMGMLTKDEAEDIGPIHVESTVVEKGVQGLKDRLQERDEATEPATHEEVGADTAAEVERQKAALAAVDNAQPDPETKAKAEELKEQLAKAGEAKEQAEGEADPGEHPEQQNTSTVPTGDKSNLF